MPEDALPRYSFQSYRGWIGRPEGYDLLAANQFTLLCSLGLRGHHTVLDLGCGSLRLGRLLIPFLERGRYFGVEPEMDLVTEGIEKELGWDAIRIKQPRILPLRNFELPVFQQRFDFIIAHSIFTHTQPDLARIAMAQCARALEPAGVLAATFIPGDPPSRPSGVGWVYPDCLSYTPAEIRRLFADAGLTASSAAHPHPCQQWWLARQA